MTKEVEALARYIQLEQSNKLRKLYHLKEQTTAKLLLRHAY